MTEKRGQGNDSGAGGRALERTLEAARRSAPALTPSRTQTWRWAVSSRLDGHRQRRIPALAAACAAAVLAGVLVIVGWRALGHGSDIDMAASGPSLSPARHAADADGQIVLADGSRVVPDGPTTVLDKAIESDADILFELEVGGAHFEVARRPSRTFRVHAGPVTVQVIGTRFQVRRQDDHSSVSVTEGRVLVSWWGGSRELGAGETGTFPPQAAGALAAPDAPAPTTRRRAPDPRPDVLFAHADRARKAGKPDVAIAHLRTLIDRFPADPHAPVAAFTIGRLLLESLGQPRQAAASFERARVLANGAPVAEDALAREVEAWASAGERALAHRRAELYRQLYPNGARLSAVMRVGGLDKSAP